MESFSKRDRLHNIDEMSKRYRRHDDEDEDKMAKFMKETNSSDDDEGIYIPAKQRQLMQEQEIIRRRNERLGLEVDMGVESNENFSLLDGNNDSSKMGEYDGKARNTSLLDEAAALKQQRSSMDKKI